MNLPQRILIMGPSGSGKSTVARRLGAKLGLPVTHLDALFWLPNWVEIDEPQFRERIAAAAAGEHWIIEGNYSRTLDLRLPRTEAVIFLDLPRYVYFPRAIWRSVKNYGRERADIGPGCKEQFDLKFFREWVWRYPERRPKQIAIMQSPPSHIRAITLTSTKEVAAFIANPFGR